MASKFTKINVGSLLKSKDPTKPNYIKINLKDKNGVISLKDGDILRAESAKFQKASIEQAFNDGKVTADILEKALARIEKMPDFVIADIVILKAND